MVESPLAVSVIVLTMGDRPYELEKLVESLSDTETPFEGVLVGNGFEPPTFEGWRSIAVDENIGISAGRALGAQNASGDILLFLDDDALNLTHDLTVQVSKAFESQLGLGAIALRVVIEGTTESLSEWLPRIQGRRPLDPGHVTSFHGAAHAVLASAYRQVGGYPGNFWYSHEETDLAWRILDAGYDIEYRPDLLLSHPLTKPSRHSKYLWYSARNRVWLARKHLPGLMAVAYQGTWLAIQLLRCRSPRQARDVLRGTREGWQQSPGERSPMSWRTVARMTKLGRPPLI